MRRIRSLVRQTVGSIAVAAAAACAGADTSPEVERREGMVELAVGEVEGPDEYTFGRVSGLTADREGRIYVADASASSVRVFDSAGLFLYRIGRQGQGPGEFDGPCCLALADDDRTLWVRDGGNSRYASFALGDTAATYRSAIPMAHRDINRWAPIGFDAAGNLIDVGSLPASALPGGRPRTTPMVARFRLDGSGKVVRVDTVPEPPADSTPIHRVEGTIGGSSAVFFLYQPFGPFALTAYSPTGELAHAASSRYSIAWRGADGTLLRTLERAAEGPPLSAAERGRAEEQIARDMRRLSLARGQIPFDVPARKQPLRGLFFDQDGRLWVERSVADGAMPAADVYDRDGRLLHEATWQVRTELSSGAIRGAVAHGLARDSLDTPRVVRIRFR